MVKEIDAVSPSLSAENDGTVNKIDKAEAPETSPLDSGAADDDSSARARAIAALESRSDCIPSWTCEKIERAELGDIIAAAEFATEFLQALDLKYYDYELDHCVLPAFDAYIESAQSGKCTPEGSFLLALRQIFPNHAAFAKYTPGPQPAWPRRSEVIRAEIVSRGHYISTLQDELELALEEEMTIAAGLADEGAPDSDGDMDDSDLPPGRDSDV